MKKFLALLAMAASFLAVSCNKNNDEDDDDQKQEESQGLGIKIDGVFDDWGALKPDVVVSAKNNPNSPWDAVSEIRCCADKDFVYYYIKFNREAVNDLMEIQDDMPIRLCLDTNNDFTTGYENYFLDPYDFIIEGGLAEGGAWTTYDGTLHQRNSEGKWDEILKPGNNLVTGKGAGGEYEILLARELFNNAIGDVFYTGIRFYGYDWGELSNMPNTSIEEGDGKGWGHLLKVTTAK